jgi:carbon starvation protein CstA
MKTFIWKVFLPLAFVFFMTWCVWATVSDYEKLFNTATTDREAMKAVFKMNAFIVLMNFIIFINLLSLREEVKKRN